MSKRDELLARAKLLEVEHKGNISNKDLEKLIQAAEAAKAASGDGTNGDGTNGDGTNGDDQTITTPGDFVDPDQRGPEGKEVVVTGPKTGRWRAGRHFTKEPVVIPAHELTAAELAAIDGDAKLTVTLRDAASE